MLCHCYRKWLQIIKFENLTANNNRKWVNIVIEFISNVQRSVFQSQIFKFFEWRLLKLVDPWSGHLKKPHCIRYDSIFRKPNLPSNIRWVKLSDLFFDLRKQPIYGNPTLLSRDSRIHIRYKQNKILKRILKY